METQRDRKLRAQVREVLDPNYCAVCDRVVPVGTEHDPGPHLSLPEQAEQLRLWREGLALTRTSTRRERHARNRW